MVGLRYGSILLIALLGGCNAVELGELLDDVDDAIDTIGGIPAVPAAYKDGRRQCVQTHARGLEALLLALHDVAFGPPGGSATHEQVWPTGGAIEIEIVHDGTIGDAQRVRFESSPRQAEPVVSGTANFEHLESGETVVRVAHIEIALPEDCAIEFQVRNLRFDAESRSFGPADGVIDVVAPPDYSAAGTTGTIEFDGDDQGSYRGRVDHLSLSDIVRYDVSLH
ncbi:MAG: hypothetical protein ACYTGZ_19505 [Planctomycetota bacterium]|jgi:hypothetical protein